MTEALWTEVFRSAPSIIVLALIVWRGLTLIEYIVKALIDFLTRPKEQAHGE